MLSTCLAGGWTCDGILILGARDNVPWFGFDPSRSFLGDESPWEWDGLGSGGGLVVEIVSNVWAGTAVGPVVSLVFWLCISWSMNILSMLSRTSTMNGGWK